jgi:hypothetical protein
MITLLPSPLLPGEAYADLVDALRRAGAPATVLKAGLRPGEGPGELVDRWSAAAPGAVLLAHSNAGYLAPLVRARLGAGEGDGQRTRIVFMDAACPRLHVAYFDTLLRAPGGWDGAPHAYLAFGDTYAEELRFARTRQWPATRLEGGHLAWLADPDGVAAAVLDLTSRLAGTT